MSNIKKEKRIRRHSRIRSKVKGTSDRPRLSVFRSNKYIYVQLIDDVTSKTLAAADSKNAKGKTLTERAEETGKAIAEAAKGKKVTEVVFDRGGYLYTGSIKALADAARKGGLKF